MEETDRKDEIRNLFTLMEPVEYWEEVTDEVEKCGCEEEGCDEGEHEMRLEVIARVDGGRPVTRERYLGFIDGALAGKAFGDQASYVYKMQVAYCMFQLENLGMKTTAAFCMSQLKKLNK